MFKVKLSDTTTINIAFVYERDSNNVITTTMCKVMTDNGLILCREWTIRSPKDKPDKNKARKVSLARAIKLLYNKADREIIWKEYFKVHNGMK